MRHQLLCAALFLAVAASAQNDYRRLLTTDPYMSDGFFIVDDAKRLQMGATHVEVEVALSELLPNGIYTRTILETLNIEPPAFYAQADPALIGTLDPGDKVVYRLTAYNGVGEVLDDWQSIGDPELLWPEICRETCEAPSYAWTLRAYSDGVSTVIDFVEGTINGSYLYFYVSQSNWGQFTQQFQATDFGVPISWLYATDPNYLGNEVVHHDDMPDDAKDYLGYGCTTPGSTNDPGYAVYKDKGPWRDFVTTSEPSGGGAGQYCISPGTLQSTYNADALVQTHMAQYDLDPLFCAGYISNGGGLTWGDGSSTICTQFNIAYTENAGEIDLMDWTVEIVDCPELGFADGLDDVSDVIVHYVDPSNGGNVLTIHVPDNTDPRLIPVPKTSLEPGLYQFIIVFDDGTMFRHYQAFSEGVTVIANFASFTDLTIYPVPVVEGTFSVDLELPVPTDCSLTVANTMGVVYYSTPLSFPQGGLNKHVVRMVTPWPSGIYHGSILYNDGSTDAFNLSVQ